ncbi:Intermembrane transport protein YebS [Vibrio stylophorae]|uniref:Intermembrane transport protein YebS n=1 Tax=Vibrio stylophorae TaxID=659351 RepID=A0ABN8DT74_9VIBR|nr:paraquat-inducible protein A [Vibrio stylophorae]CAH0533464.1 Intermembrane transport protein YebS [Vibrio stylophorae]
MSQLNCYQYQRCPECDLAVAAIPVSKGFRARCPRCEAKLEMRLCPPGSALPLAIFCLLLFIPAHIAPIITIQLFGVMIPAPMISGTLTLFDAGFFFVAGLILFCGSIAPLLLYIAVLMMHWGLKKRQFQMLRYGSWLVKHLRGWCMLDVFLISLAIACFKIRDYADIFTGIGLLCFILLQLATLMLLARLKLRRYWHAWQPAQYDCHTSHSCTLCGLSQPAGAECRRCHSKLYLPSERSVQNCWAYLLTATIAIFPANLYPISILLTNGKRLEDTIFSGVSTLMSKGMVGIGLIIFIASIVVPVAKILGLGFILICIRWYPLASPLFQAKCLRFIQLIGKWSMMDLFVISLMMTLIDRGQLLDFTPGLGAVAFAFVVVLTMLATESLDPRLIWHNRIINTSHAQGELHHG